MPTYQVTLPSGKTYEIDSPSPLSDADAYRHAQSQEPEQTSQTQQSPQPLNAAAVIGDSPGMFGSAGRRELGRTATEAGIGLVRSPIDAVKGLFNLARHPIDSVSNTVNAIAHPIDTVKALGDDPRAAGSMIGQLLLGKVIPENLGTITNATGRGVSAVGRAAESVGDAIGGSKFSVGGMTIPGLGAAEALFRGDPKGLAVAASPYALKYGGKGMQAIGGALERAPEAMRSLTGTDEATMTANDLADKRAAGLRGEIPRKRWAPKTAEQTAREAAEDASRTVPNEGQRVDLSGMKDWPVDEPVYGDIRPALADVDMAKAAHEKGWSPELIRRVIMESPSLQSLKNSR